MRVEIIVDVLIRCWKLENLVLFWVFLKVEGEKGFIWEVN